MKIKKMKNNEKKRKLKMELKQWKKNQEVDLINSY